MAQSKNVSVLINLMMPFNHWLQTFSKLVNVDAYENEVKPSDNIYNVETISYINIISRKSQQFKNHEIFFISPDSDGESST